MRLAVTGASGFVGGAVCRGAVAAGHEVVALGRRAALDPAHVAGAPYRSHDLRHGPPDLEGAAAVVHAAGVATDDASAQELWDSHVGGARAVLAAMGRAGHQLPVAAQYVVLGVPVEQVCPAAAATEHEVARVAPQGVGLESAVETVAAAAGVLVHGGRVAAQLVPAVAAVEAVAAADDGAEHGPGVADQLVVVAAAAEEVGPGRPAGQDPVRDPDAERVAPGVGIAEEHVGDVGADQRVVASRKGLGAADLDDHGVSPSRACSVGPMPASVPQETPMILNVQGSQVKLVGKEYPVLNAFARQYYL